MKVIFVLASIASLARALVVDPQCINNLCHVASGCERAHKYCLGTGNAYCGPFRLSLSYWKDAGSPGSDFKSCVFDYDCSVRTVVAYMAKYASDCNYDGKIDCSDFAAIHLAGGGSSCSQKWVFASNHYKKYLRLMSQRPRTRVSVYEPTGLESSVVPSEEEISNVADSTSNFTITGLASLRDARRINFPVRTTRTPHRRYTVIYWNGNRRRLPEITNILDAHPWIIETARRPSSHDRPSFKPTVSRRVTYFTPTTPMTTASSTTTTAAPLPYTTPSTTSSPPITVTKKRRVRPRTTIRPLVVNHPAGRPSNRRPQATTQPMSTSTTTMASTTTATTTTTTTPAPPPSTTRAPSSPPVISYTERPTRSTTPKAWWMSATRRRYPTYTWFDTTNPWSRESTTTATRTHRPRTTTVATTFFTTSTTTERPSTIRTSTERTSIRTTPPTTLTSPPSTEHTSTRTYMTFEPHRTRPVTDSISTEASVAVSSSKKPVLNDSSVVVNELQASCMECICAGSSESCNFDQTFNCHKEDECGPYQIDYAYWYEAGYPNFKGNGDSDFHECATDRQCAEKTVRTYLDKNKMDCNSDGMVDCIDYAAIHKAGPDACHKQWVYESKYWSSFSQCHGFDFFRKRRR